MKFNYRKICLNLLRDLPLRTQDVISRRFGLKNEEKETLESIGRDYGICRERVRQIEEDGLAKIKPKIAKHQEILQYFFDQLKSSGNLKKEKSLLEELGGQKFQNQIFFLLTLGNQFKRLKETENYHSLWTIDQNSLKMAKKVIADFIKKLKEKREPLNLESYKSPLSPDLPSKVLVSFLEISKQILKGPQGLYGLADWPEINPRGVRDKAYLVFKKERRPLHFSQVARFIDDLKLEKVQKRTNPQTVHNELIRDPKFVLVGRGTYALREWGYLPGVVRDIILKTLRENKKPLSKEEIVREVLKQRLVKENTILLNLSNKKYFQKDSQGRYTIREA